MLRSQRTPSFRGAEPTVPVLVDERTGEIGVATGRVAIRWNSAIAPSQVKAWLDAAGFEIVRDFGSAAIVIPRDRRHPLDPITDIQASEDIISAEPQLLKRRAKR